MKADISKRIIPAGAVPEDRGELGIVYRYTSPTHNLPAAISFTARAQKPAWHYRFPNEQTREARIKAFFEARERAKAMNADRVVARRERREKLAAQIKVGAVFVSIWGYDQTNIDFWEVIGRESKLVVAVQHLGNRIVEGSQGNMSENVLPNPRERGVVKRASIIDGTLRLEGEHDFMDAVPWDGRPRYCSHYA